MADDKNIVVRYNLVYINYNLCQKDNGRVLGYDNAHGLHHKHDMGTVEPIEFIGYEKIEERFQRECEVIYDKKKATKKSINKARRIKIIISSDGISGFFE